MDFLLGHELTHGSALSQATRSRYPDKTTMQVFATNFDFDVLSGVGVSAAPNALRALQACEVIFDWDGDGSDELVAECATFHSEPGKPEPSGDNDDVSPN